MKNWLLPTLTLLVMFLPSCVQGEQLPADATLVVRATVFSGGHNCDKFCSYRVRVIRTLSGSPNISPGTVVDIQAYSFGPKIPQGECTLYLRPYSDKPSRLWAIAYVDDPPPSVMILLKQRPNNSFKPKPLRGSA